MAREGSNPSLVTCVALLVGGGAGYAARGALEGGERAAAAEGPARAAESAALARGLERVEQALVALERRLGAAVPPAAQPPATRSALEPSVEQDLRGLVERLERLELGARGAAPALVLPAGRPQPLPAPPSGTEEYEERLRRYQLWTYQQVADAFGRPERVKAGNEGATLYWMYRREEPVDGYEWVIFHFSGGLVYNVSE